MNSSQFLTLTLFALLVCGCVNGDVECFSEHRSLLLDLKHGFTMTIHQEEHPEELASWEPSSNCCNWKEITCDSKSGHVIGLDLGGHYIAGDINSDALFGLTSLRALNLSHTQFDRISIPQPGFENLKELRQLDLSDVGFTGQIPIGISRLAGLEYLDLSDWVELRNPNFHTMIRNLNNLRVLKLRSVDLHQDVEWVTSLVTSVPHLQVLDLAQTNLTGSLREELFQLKHLEYLDLSWNNISGGLPDFPKDSALQHMFLSDTNISGAILESFGNLKNLTEINLSQNTLSGVIPASIGKLVKLTRLDLRASGLTGPIPRSIGKLAELTWLDLSQNGLTGPVPEFLFSLPLLQRLALGYNQLFGELDVPRNTSTSLKEILLSGNQLCGQIPPSFFYLPSLEALDLDSNNFSGAIELDKIVILNNLTDLSLSNNRLKLGEFDDNIFLSFPKLSFLGLASCGLTKLPTFLNNQKKMLYLDLSNNRISSDIPRWMWSIGESYLNLSHNLFNNTEGLEDIPMSRYVILDLRYNMLHGQIPVPPPSSYVVDFSNNNFSSAITPEFFFNLSEMDTFSAANNKLIGGIPPSICNATRLRALDLSNNMFSGSIPSCLLESDRFTDMNLGRNWLQGTIPQNITRLCQLNSLILSDNHLEGSLPRSLVNCRYLAVLDLGNNHIADTFPFWLGENVLLQVLSLKANRFYGPLGPSESQEANCTFPQLQIFDLSSNHFNGKLSRICFSGLRLMMNKLNLTSSHPYIHGYEPPSFYEINIGVIKGQEVSLLKILYTVVDFSNNSFEGDIPPVIGRLQGLNVLNLSHNSLTGNIPCDLGNLIELESLDLSTNHLSGEIPQCLTSLTFLEWLNLSNNNLTGRIPQDKQFSTFPNTSYQENPGLCGIPLSKQCGNAITNIPSSMPPAVISDHSSSSSSYVIGLALSVGAGFGVGIAVVLVLQNVPLKFFRESR